MNKKLQVFVSSTYTDLKEERQTAVEAILDSGHIPAGMELFKAGKPQLETIRKWIDESDVYMLILGGRYGSIEEDSGLSYTELEYKYALSKNMPVFAIVLDDSFLQTKTTFSSKYNIFEKDNTNKYNSFKDLVMRNIVKFVYNIDQIPSAIKSQINDIINSDEFFLSGWIRNNKKNFNTSEELDTYIAKQIQSAQKCVYDLTWKNYYHAISMRPNYNSYIKSQYSFLDNAKKILERGVFYREIFTFPNKRKERILKMQELIKYDNYWCGFFESDQLTNNFPKLHITIIDDSEVIFANYDYKGNLCSTFDKNIVNILETYFDECWSLCQKIKDFEGIHQATLNKVISFDE